MSTPGAQKSQRKSLFLGRRIPLVQDGNTLLYPRYTHVSEVLADFKPQPKSVQTQATVHAASPAQGRAQSALLQRVGAALAPASPAATTISQPVTPSQTSPSVADSSIKKRKRDKPKKKKIAETTVEPVKKPEKAKKRKITLADGSKQTSGTSNADEAANLRARLGVISSPAATLAIPAPAPFTFGFGFQPATNLASAPSPAALFQAAATAPQPAVDSTSEEESEPAGVAIAMQSEPEATSSSEEDDSDTDDESSSEEESEEEDDLPPNAAAIPAAAMIKPPGTEPLAGQATTGVQQPETPLAKNGGSAPPVPGQAYVPRRVFAGGMPFSYEEPAIREYWLVCGEIESLDMMRFPDSGRFKGMVFITFASEEGYNNALTCDGSNLDGQTLRVDRCKAKRGVAAAGAAPPKEHLMPQPTKVEGYWVAYVGNISFEVTAEELKEVFDDVGVDKVRLHTDKATGQSKGYAHVHFNNEEGLEKAVNMSGHNIAGRNLKISYAQKKK